MQALRYEPKGFSQCRWENGQWVSGGPPAEARVLFCLPDVLAWAAAGQTIHLTEGEKDAIALRQAGVPATSAPMGATKWQPQYAQQLAGASLVVLHADRDDLTVAPDKEDMGAEHVAVFREHLTAAGIPVRIVQAAIGKDADEHLAAGRGVDEFVDVSEEALTARLQRNQLVREHRRVAINEARTTARAGRAEHTAPSDQQQTQPDSQEDSGEVPPQNVAAHPTVALLPEPEFVIPMSRGLWRYELGGDGRRDRGVYVGEDRGWRLVAPFPHVQARIVRRDGTGRRVGTDYLLSAQADSAAIVITDEGLGRGRWANELGVALSDDDKIQRAVSTAIRCHGERVPERESTARVDQGRVSIPCPQTLPPGYLVTGDTSREEGLAAWADIFAQAARSPNLALLLGASAVAPFVAALGRQSHIVAIYGDSDRGKTIAMRVAAAIWGNSVDAGGVLKPWNATLTAVPRYLGMLGVLPPLIDEIGQAGAATPQQWGKLIYDVAEGGQRMISEMRGPGVRVGMPWHGVMISAGNGRMTDGLGAGRYAGVVKRVVELATPFTIDAEHAELIQGGDARTLLRRAYGHAGLELLERHSAATVGPIIGEVEQLLGLPEGGNHRTVARHLHAHVAGAAMLDDVAGTGTALYEAALAAARAYMGEWAEPEHDADRIINELRDMIAREPAMWPTVSSYRDHKRVRTFDDSDRDTIPTHGVNRTVCGLQDDDGGWVAVFSRAWRDVCKDLDVDSTVACRELHARGILHTTESRRRHGEWTRMVREAGTGMYYLTLPPVPRRHRRGSGPRRPSARTPGRPRASHRPSGPSPPAARRHRRTCLLWVTLWAVVGPLWVTVAGPDNAADQHCCGCCGGIRIEVTRTRARVRAHTRGGGRHGCRHQAPAARASPAVRDLPDPGRTAGGRHPVSPGGVSRAAARTPPRWPRSSARDPASRRSARHRHQWSRRCVTCGGSVFSGSPHPPRCWMPSTPTYLAGNAIRGARATWVSLRCWLAGTGCGWAGVVGRTGCLTWARSG